MRTLRLCVASPVALLLLVLALACCLIEVVTTRIIYYSDNALTGLGNWVERWPFDLDL